MIPCLCMYKMCHTSDKQDRALLLSPFLQGSWNFNGLWVPQHNAPNEQTLPGLSLSLSLSLSLLNCFVYISRVRTGVVSSNAYLFSFYHCHCHSHHLLFSKIPGHYHKHQGKPHFSLNLSSSSPCNELILTPSDLSSFFFLPPGWEYVPGKPPRGGRSGHCPATEHCQCPRGTHQSGGPDSSNLMSMKTFFHCFRVNRKKLSFILQTLRLGGV